MAGGNRSEGKSLVQGKVPAAGTERGGVEAAGTERRGRPGRRSAAERVKAVLELLRGKTTVKQVARRFGVHGSTVERWREMALEAIEAALRQGSGKSAREQELEKRLRSLERAFTDLAIRLSIKVKRRARGMNHEPPHDLAIYLGLQRLRGGRSCCREVCK